MKKKQMADAADIVYAGIDAIDPVDGPRMAPVGPVIKDDARTFRFLALYRDEYVEVTVNPARRRDGLS